MMFPQSALLKINKQASGWVGMRRRLVDREDAISRHSSHAAACAAAVYKLSLVLPFSINDWGGRGYDDFVPV